MKKFIYSVLVLLVLGGAFFFGSWYGRAKPHAGGAPEGRRILHYVDPMNPAHTSPEPGLAPCGMKMEPVYADDEGKATGVSATFPVGTVQISADKQQLIGVRLETVKKEAVQHTIRLLGRVAPDETRVYIINATVDGWITKVSYNTTGSLVKKDTVLAAFYSPEFLAAEQALLFALNARERVRISDNATQAEEDQFDQFNITFKQYKDTLRNLGMGDLQTQEMIRTRKYIENVEITSPADGFIIVRNVSAGLRFEKGTELFRIADLSRVWILADLYEDEAEYVKPGQRVSVSLLHQKKMIEATVSDVLPQFDPESRTLKVRLEVDNPDFVLRPEMFVDVEFLVQLPAAVLIPTDALLDTGLRQTVFIDRSNGYFEPRQVKVARRIGDQVEIVEGLVPGDRIVSSGTFLLDSESRMKMAAAGFTEAPAKDLVCGMDVDTAAARSLGRVSVYQDKTYYFCADHCKEEFERNPAQYLGATSESGQSHD